MNDSGLKPLILCAARYSMSFLAIKCHSELPRSIKAPILSSERGRYDARQKSQRWIVLNVQPLLGFLLAEVDIRVITTKLQSEGRLYNTKQQPRHKEGEDNVEDLCAKEGVEDVTILL